MTSAEKSVCVDLLISFLIGKILEGQLLHCALLSALKATPPQAARNCTLEEIGLAHVLSALGSAA